MSVPCFNCHGVPYTTPWPPEQSYGECRGPEHPEGESWDCLARLGPVDIETNPQSIGRLREWLEYVPPIFQHWATFPVIEMPSPLLTEPPECPAEPRWPEGMRPPAAPEGAMPWWVRGNFERLRSDPLPLRLDLREAEITATVRVRAGASLPLVDGLVFLTAGSEGGEITARLGVTDNEIPLLRESLLQFHNLQVQVRPGDFTGSWMDVSPEEITTGDFGGLHLVGRAPTSLMFFLQPFMVPVPEPGFDWPTYRQWLQIETWPGLTEHCFDREFSEGHIGVCPQPTRFPDRSDGTAPVDLNVIALLPARLRCQIDPLLDRDGRLPQYLSLEDLIGLLTDPEPRECPPAAGTSRWSRDVLESFFESAEVSVEIQDLQDLYLPGRLDLGGSHLTARLQYSREDGIRALLSDFEIRFDAMGYPDVSETAPFQILGGRISPAEGTDSGIRLHRDAATGDLEVEADLRLSFQLLTPGLGEIAVDADLHASTLLASTEAGLRPVPGFSTFELSELRIENAEGNPILENGDILLSDDLDSLMSIPSAFAAAQTEAGIVGLRFDARLGNGHELHGEAALDWRQDAAGAYLPPPRGGVAQVLQNFPVASADLQFQDVFPGRRTDGVRGEFHLTSVPAAAPDRLEPEPPALHGRFSADRLRPDRRAPGHTTLIPVIRDGEIHFQYVEHAGETPVHEEGEIDLAIGLFRWTLGRLGLVELNDLGAEISLDRLRISEIESRFRLPTVTVEANAAGSSRGRLSGPIRIEQSRSEGLEFVWNSAARTLEMSGLDLVFGARRLDVLPEALRRTLDPRIAGVGIDGHLSGDFRMHLTPDRRCWHGEGEIGLRGDTAGDIYFVDAAGRPFGPSLFRDTRWRFRRVAWVNWERGYALGEFQLRTLVNPSAVPGFIPDRAAPGLWEETEALYGPHGSRLLPYEIAAAMVYDNQPFSPAGFRHRIEDYIYNLFLSPQVTLRGSSPRVPEYCREPEGGDR